MAFSGVRSSWLMLARKSLLARVAASACRWVDAQLIDQYGQLLAVLPLRVVGRLDLLGVSRQLAFRLLARPDFLFERRRAVRDLAHLDDAAPARHDQE